MSERDAVVAPHRVRNVVVLVVSNLLGGVGVASGAAVGALLAQELGGTAMGGLAQAASVLGAAVAAVPLAGTAARRGRRTALTWGYALALAGAVLIVGAAMLQQAVIFLVGMALYGVASAANLQSRYAGAENATATTRAMTMSIVIWATTIGSVAGPNLAAPGAALGVTLGIPELSGPYLFSLVGYLLAGLVIGLLYRDPSAAAERVPAPVRAVSGAGVEPANATAPAAGPAETRRAPGEAPGTDERPAGALQSLRWAWGHGRARFAVVTTATAHTVMIMVMVMTPLHMQLGGMSLQLIGLVISLHVLGMFALSPLFGVLADRWGAVPTAVTGLSLQAAAVVLGLAAAIMSDAAVTSDGVPLHQAHDGVAAPTLTAGVVTAIALILLGLGWSACLIAASALLADVGEPRVRVPLQGATDALMNYAGGAAAALAGPLLLLGGFQAVNIAGAILLVPAVIALVTRHRTRTSSPAAH